MKKALLLIQLGTPLSSNPKSVGHFLKEFLMDEYVIDYPFWLRWFIVNVLIVPRRKYTSSEAYQSIWMKEGSPLLFHSKNLLKKLQSHFLDEVKVFLSMRYGSPSISEALEELNRKNFDKIFVQSLYPHHTLSTTETAYKEVLKRALEMNFQLHQFHFLPEFFKESFYIQPLSRQIKDFLDKKKQEGIKMDHLIFSYHGLPQRHIRKLDPQNFCSFSNDCCSSFIHSRCYRAQCFKTTELLCKEVGWSPSQSSTSFQSRLGQNWIPPYTVDLLEDLKTKGVQKVAVVAPSFLADCLETLEEIGLQLKDEFIKGERERELFLIPCLNSNQNFVESFSQYLKANFN